MRRSVIITFALTMTTAALAGPAPRLSTGGNSRDLLEARKPRLTQTFTEDFSKDSNEGGWTVGGAEFHFRNGGNKGAYIESRNNDTFAPQPRTTTGSGSQFTGNYASRQVIGLGVDLETIRVDFSAAERPLSVLLISDPDTPEDPFDDCTAYLLGTEFAPEPGQGWRSYAFTVPSDSATLPEGWGILEGCPEATPDDAWTRVIHDVDELRYFFGDPTFFFIFQQWTTGLDNPSITVKLQ
ncbi:MAG TPA: hypothetical protein VFB67_04670 [Candidatus Polarisedimenticolaceae bacterium]|nr:hypothetical protein [Candidatus Polarisedimenticolaceae bacterium]